MCRRGRVLTALSVIHFPPLPSPLQAPPWPMLPPASVPEHRRRRRRPASRHYPPSLWPSPSSLYAAPSLSISRLVLPSARRFPFLAGGYWLLLVLSRTDSIPFDDRPVHLFQGSSRYPLHRCLLLLGKLNLYIAASKIGFKNWVVYSIQIKYGSPNTPCRRIQTE